MLRSKVIPKARFWETFKNQNVCPSVCGFVWNPV